MMQTTQRLNNSQEAAIKGLHHISMKCKDPELFEKAVGFYTDILGFHIARRWAEGVMLESGGTGTGGKNICTGSPATGTPARIEIFCNGDGIRELGAVRHFALATNRVDELAAKVEAAGYEVFIKPKDIVIPSTPEFHARMSFFFGPLGEQVELFDDTASAVPVTETVAASTGTESKIRFLEELAANGHVALDVQLYDGWLLKFSKGHTGRANSVSVLYPSTIDIEEKIDYCEACYKNHNLPCIFKLTTSKNDYALNTSLEKRGYEVVTPTDMLVLELGKMGSIPAWGETASSAYSGTNISINFSSTPTEEWLTAYFPYEGISDKAKQEIFRQMLAKVQVKTIYGSVVKDGKIVACASAAIEQGYMLLQNVVVSPEERGQGYGKLVCKSLIAKAKEEGAEYSYLQVVQSNKVAYNLYSKLGFEKVYSYWYMRQK